jgi:uncharacterized protein YeaO (DUF488 family)
LIKRVYDAAGPEDGARFLVDRLWPRGIKREALKLDGWLKEVAPSDDLRHWYRHEPEKWPEFQQRYFAELDSKPETWQTILEAARQKNVTLLFSSREININNAAALKAYLEKRLKSG